MQNKCVSINRKWAALKIIILGIIYLTVTFLSAILWRDQSSSNWYILIGEKGKLLEQ